MVILKYTLLRLIQRKSMKILLVIMLASTLLSVSEIFGESPTFFETVKFIQYLDENTALEEVRNGNLDMYYYKISSDRLENLQSRQGLNVFDSTGGSYSILVNPAESDKFNPFSSKEARFALNYLVDRKLIVNELMGGYGAAMISYYGPFDPEYLSIIEKLESFNFKYNPVLAQKMIEESLIERGAQKENGIWKMNDDPIKITFFIRSDDPVRKSIGEILSSELEKIGFTVVKDFGDLNKAFVVVYGSNPAELRWNLYTEGWASSAFVRYNSVGLGQMYAPWFSNMPGFNDPTYWNYKNEQLDELTQRVYLGDFKSADERTELIREAIDEGVKESVRIFLASKIDRYVVNEKIHGVVNDFGAGIPSRFTPINAKGPSKDLVIGVKQIYQGAWNPVMGLTDSYSRHIWGVISDPLTFKHPFSGETIPIRGNWTVNTSGPDGALEVPEDAIIWNPYEQRWDKLGAGVNSTSKVTFDFEFSNWHNGQKMDMNDIIHSVYFTIEWGTQTDENDKTFDTEYTPRASQAIETLKGIRPIDDNTLEVFVDYWHFDEGEIADWGAWWNVMPWEMYTAMEQAVIDGKISFSRSGATNKGINWLSLIIPNDSKIIQNNLEKLADDKTTPKALEQFETDKNYFINRYKASSNWIEQTNHAVISNGPYVLEGYSPESRTIKVKTFTDDSYPFSQGHWSEFENPNVPKITKINLQEVMTRGNSYEIDIDTYETDEIKYFITDSRGNTTLAETIDVNEKNTSIKIPKDITEDLPVGATELKVFAISSSIARPDFYTTSFFVSDEKLEQLPIITSEEIEFGEEIEETIAWIIIPIIIILLIIIIKKKRPKPSKKIHNP